MAEAANHYPRTPSTGDSSAAVRSPQSVRNAAARVVSSSPREHIRGLESEFIGSISSSLAASPSSPLASSAVQGQTSRSSTNLPPLKDAAGEAYFSSSVFSLSEDAAAEAHPESFDNASTESSNESKKPVWNKPSNEAVDVGAIMGAVSWPALSESTRVSPKLSSDSWKTGSGAGVASFTQKQVVTNDANPSLGPNHVALTHQKSMKRGGGSSNVAANGGFHEPVVPLDQVGEMPFDDAGLAGSSVPETSSRVHMERGSGQRGGFVSQSRSGNYHSQHSNSYRRGNGTPHPRSDSYYHQNHGGRDRVNHDRISHRSFNGRYSHMQPQRVVPRGFLPQPPHTVTPFLPPPPMPVRPFGNHMIYAEVPPPVFYIPVPPPDSLGGMSVVTPAPPPSLFFPASDSLLHAKLITQINYYFSNENLISDTFLRQNMNEEGWVPIELIAGFKKVMILTTNIPFILDALRTSDVVEVKNGKVRKRNDWMRWILPRSIEFGTVSSPRSVERSSHDTLRTNIQSMSLGEKKTNKALSGSFLSRSSSGNLNSSPLQAPPVQADSGISILSRSSSQ